MTTQNHSPQNAEGAPSSAGLTQQDLVNQLISQQAQSQEPVDESLPKEEEAQEEQAQPEEEASPDLEPEADDLEAKEESESDGESEEEEPEEDEDSIDVLSNIDLENLTDEQRKKLNSRAVERIGKLTKRAKAAEEQIAKLQQQLQQNKNPLDVEEEIKENPFSSIETIEDLQAQNQTAKQTIKEVTKLLRKASNKDDDEVVYEANGHELTKAQLYDALENAQDAVDTYLPAQLKVIQQGQMANAIKQEIEQELPKQFSWYQDEKSDVRKNFEAMKADPRLKTLQGDKSVLAQLDWILAHAANSMFGSPKPVEAVAKKPNPASQIKVNPPSNPSSSSSKSERLGDPSVTKKKEKLSQFKKSGSSSDLISLLAMQMSEENT